MSKTRRKKSHTRKGEEETKTEDIKDGKQREQLLDEDNCCRKRVHARKRNETRQEKTPHTQRHSIC
jgi:hypothetical protein